MNILRKFGIYKKSEIDKLIESTAKLLGSVDGVIDGAKLDRQCYKAAIGMVNDVNHAAKMMSEFCKITNCVECGFTSEGGICRLAYIPPCDWRIYE